MKSRILQGMSVCISLLCAVSVLPVASQSLEGLSAWAQQRSGDGRVAVSHRASGTLNLASLQWHARPKEDAASPDGAPSPWRDLPLVQVEGAIPCCEVLQSISGVNFRVYALLVSGPDVYVGGSFTQAGGQPANGIARWDGSTWHALGDGVSGSVLALAMWGGSLYVGGVFSQAGGQPIRGIARWDGTAWHALDLGVDSWVYAFAVSGSDLFVGGSFSLAGGQPANRIARWDGSAWHPLGSGVNSDNPVTLQVKALAASGDDLFVGGSFTQAGGQPASRIARWDGSAWHPLGSGVSSVGALALLGGDLYVGGSFTQAGGVPANRIARWDGTTWHALGSGFNNSVEALDTSSGTLFAGGDFSASFGQPANRIAHWDGSAWRALGSGVNSIVRALAVSGTDLFVGGDFTQAGGQPASYVARWNGTQWFDQLPVQLTSFTALTLNRSVVLQWSTLGEINNSGFEVQHLRGLEWQPLGFVPGHGTTTEQQQYRYTTDSLLPGTHAFRLKQIDFDGTSTLSPVVEGTVELNADHVLLPPFPNPARTTSTLHVYSFHSERLLVTVVDMLGREVARPFHGVIAGGHPLRVELEVTTLARGTYMYRVQGERFAHTGTLTVVR